MIYVMTVGSVALTVLAVVGVACAWGLSRLMDLANERKSQLRQTRFSMALQGIEGEPIAASIYYGARWVGICILIGWLFSRAV